jgi:hypothetical protein
MIEFILLVVLLQPITEHDTSRWVVVSSFSTPGLSENGCKNAQLVLDRMGRDARFAVVSACVPKNIAKIEVEKK